MDTRHPRPPSPPFGLAMPSNDDMLAADRAFALDLPGGLFADIDASFFDPPGPPDPMPPRLLPPPALHDSGGTMPYAQPQGRHPPQRSVSSRTASASSASVASSSLARPMAPSSPPASPPSSPPSPSPAQRPPRRRCRLSSSAPSVPSAPQTMSRTTAPSRRLPPRYPADPDDWRARLRYCEAVRDKGQLTAAMVRLLDVPDGLPPDEVAARRAGNLRLDRVREQRLKARNNSAAKRSRQRKVERIEAAEALIAALQRERTALQAEVGRLQRALAAATATATVTANT